LQSQGVLFCEEVRVMQNTAGGAQIKELAAEYAISESNVKRTVRAHRARRIPS